MSKLTLRVKKMLPKIQEAIRNNAGEYDTRRRFNISPRLYAQIKADLEEQDNGKAK